MPRAPRAGPLPQQVVRLDDGTVLQVRWDVVAFSMGPKSSGSPPAAAMPLRPSAAVS